MDIASALVGFYMGCALAGFSTMYIVRVPLQKKLSEISERLNNLEQAHTKPLNENTKGELTTEAPVPTCRA